MTTKMPLALNPGVRLSESKAGIARVEVLDKSKRFLLSWDRFMRLHRTAEQINAILANDFSARLLDVGGFDGALGLFLNEYKLDVVDPLTTQCCGTAITSALDYAYDLVVSIDALEHVPPDKREAFVSETVRVCRLHYLINFPSAATIEAQKTVLELTNNEFVKQHVEWPLPVASEVAAQLADKGFEVEIMAHTSCAVWISQYVLQTVAPELAQRVSNFQVNTFLNEPCSMPLYDLLICKRIRV